MPTLIPLTRGMFATVDDADAEWLSRWKWNAKKVRDGVFYASRRRRLDEPGSGVHVSMHRAILGVDSSVWVDHWDGCSLNNQRGNLRIATQPENCRNARIRKDNSTGYKGVSRAGRKFRARIAAHGANIVIGTFDTAEEAHTAYVAAALELHGDFARLA